MRKGRNHIRLLIALLCAALVMMSAVSAMAAEDGDNHGRDAQSESMGFEPDPETAEDTEWYEGPEAEPETEPEEEGTGETAEEDVPKGEESGASRRTMVITLAGGAVFLAAAEAVVLSRRSRRKKTK